MILEMAEKLQLNEEDSCGRCEKNFVAGKHKIVSCSTCKLNFHIAGVHVSQSKFEILLEETDLFWFCNSCKRTTANMINNLAHLELRLRAIEAEREKDQKKLTTMQERYEALQNRIVSIEETISSLEVNDPGELESIRFMLNDMLSEVPNCNAVVRRFEEIEQGLEQCQQDLAESKMNKHSNIIYGGLDLGGFDSNQTSKCNIEIDADTMKLTDDYNTAAVSNELCERKKREMNLVIHNLPETASEEHDIATVKDLLEEISKNDLKQELQIDPFTNQPRIYRLGRKSASKMRTIKVHLKSSNVREYILDNCRRLADSVKFKAVVLQKDMTVLEREHLKRLLFEKKRRNDLAKTVHEEPNWIIRSGVLCRKFQTM